ncbi:MAG: glycosyltransferase family 2 protein [bacterium]|nr:glycosyltransferase family 2 protein [bacterium]
MDLSVIIVSWNVREKLKDNLRALFESRNINFEVFVVDNNSSDRTVDLVKKKYPQVKLIANRENLGFAKASNQALKLASGRYILLLNPDMIVRPDTLKNMLAWLDANPRAAIAGCKLVDERGEIIRQVRRFPRLSDQLAIILKLPHFWPAILNKYIPDGFDYEKAAPVDSIRGSFFMIKKQTVEKIGLLDERFFVWFEEVDYCRRAREAGLEVWYAPAAVCLDLVGQSFAQLKRGAAQKYFRDSQLAYFKKWRPVWQYYILKNAWPIGIFLAAAGERLKIKRVRL